MLLKYIYLPSKQTAAIHLKGYFIFHLEPQEETSGCLSDDSILQYAVILLITGN